MCVRGYIEIFLLQDNADAPAKTPQQVALTPNTGADMCTHMRTDLCFCVYMCMRIDTRIEVPTSMLIRAHTRV